MKRFVFILAIILPIITFTSCSKKDDDSSIKTELIGVWKEYGNRLTKTSHIELKADGTGAQWVENLGMVDKDSKINFVWSSTENEIIIIIEERGSETIKYMFRNGKLYLSTDENTIVYIKE